MCTLADDGGAPVVGLGRDDPLAILLLDEVEGRKSQATLFAIVHLPVPGRL